MPSSYDATMQGTSKGTEEDTAFDLISQGPGYKGKAKKRVVLCWKRDARSAGDLTGIAAIVL
jgi:hypothetical protein